MADLAVTMHFIAAFSIFSLCQNSLHLFVAAAFSTVFALCYCLFVLLVLQINRL